MRNQKQNIFRQESLERLSSPERLDQLMQVVVPKDWIGLTYLGSLVLLAVGWSLWGKIPVTVAGRGVLLYPDRTAELQVPVAGQLKVLTVKSGDTIRKGDVIGLIDRADLREQFRQQTLKLKDLETQNQQLTNLARQRGSLDIQVLQQKRQTLEQMLQDKQELSPKLRANDLLTLQKQQQTLQRTLHDKQTLTASLGEQLKNRKLLRAEGAISADVELEAVEAYQTNLQQIASLNAQLQELNSKKTAIEQTYRDTLSQISDLQAQQRALKSQADNLVQQALEGSLSRKNQIQAVKQTLAQLTVQLRDSSRITSEYSGRILELSAKSGQVLSQGTRLGIIETTNETTAHLSKLAGLVYFPIKDGKQIQPGMLLQITPDTVKRERFGGILGKVKSVSVFPVTKQRVLNAIGNADVTESLLFPGGQVEVLAELEVNPATVSGYQWSSSLGPEMPISPGTTASVRVTVAQWAPITFALPVLKAASGIN